MELNCSQSSWCRIQEKGREKWVCERNRAVSVAKPARLSLFLLFSPSIHQFWVNGNLVTPLYLCSHCFYYLPAKLNPCPPVYANAVRSCQSPSLKDVVPPWLTYYTLTLLKLIQDVLKNRTISFIVNWYWVKRKRSMSIDCVTPWYATRNTQSLSNKLKVTVYILSTHTGKYMQMMNILKPIAFDVIHCVSQLFDYYLYAVYTFFGRNDMVQYFWITMLLFDIIWLTCRKHTSTCTVRTDPVVRLS